LRDTLAGIISLLIDQRRAGGDLPLLANASSGA